MVIQSLPKSGVDTTMFDAAPKHDVLDLDKDAPLRPPSWRWERAKLERADAKLARLWRSTDDEFVKKARDFQAARARCKTSYDFLMLGRRYPRLIHADRLEREPHIHTKWEIQARLLAGETYERIAERVKVHPEAVAWYAALFFDVADRLANKGWVAHVVLGESLQCGLHEREYDMLWKIYGYIGGPIVLDAMVDRTFCAARPDKPDQLPAYADEEIEHDVAIKGMIAARTLSVNSYTQPMILEIHQKYKELKQKAEGTSGGPGNMAVANIQVMLESITFSVGASTKILSSKDPSKAVGRVKKKIATADGQSAELRSGEILELGVGQEPDGYKELKEIKYPEERHGAAQSPDE
jgi:hypothetical protein